MAIRVDKVVKGNLVDHTHGTEELPILVDTKANIIATASPDSGHIAFATDVNRLYVYDGTNWQECAVVFKPRTSGVVPGYEKNSSLSGYGDEYISDKTLHNIQIKGHPATKSRGSFWLDTTVEPNVLHLYTDSEKTVMIDFTFENDELEHEPVVDAPIDVWSGNSNQLGANGLPLYQEYQQSMGAYPVPILIDGGTF